MSALTGNGSGESSSVVSKVAAILRIVRFGGALTVTEIARIAALPVSTTHRLVVELNAWQMLHRDPAGRYTLTPPSVSDLGTGDPPSEVRETAASTVDDLSGATRADVRLGVLDGCRVGYLQKTYGPWPLSDFTRAATLPAHATAVGKALLAFSPPDVVERIIKQGLDRYTPATLTTAEVRVRDVATDLPVVLPALIVAVRALSRQWHGNDELVPVPSPVSACRSGAAVRRSLAAVPSPEAQPAEWWHDARRASPGGARRRAGGQP